MEAGSSAVIRKQITDENAAEGHFRKKNLQCPMKKKKLKKKGPLDKRRETKRYTVYTYCIDYTRVQHLNCK